MSAALAILAVVLALAVWLLSVPVDVVFRFDGIEAFRGRVAIRWLYGRVRFRIRFPRVADVPPAGRHAAARAPAETHRRKIGRRALAVLRHAAFRRRLCRLAKDLVRAAHLRDLRVRLRLGLGDPADTGRLWAWMGPIRAAAQSLRRADVRIEPAFPDPACDLEMCGRMRPVPLQLLALAIVFALSPASIRAWFTLGARHV